jgi:DNA-binding transcriptional MerR regulator
MTIQLLASPEAAKRLGIEPQTLRIWRQKGLGPKYVRLSSGSIRGRVGYDVEDLERWVAEHRFGSTAEETVRAAGAR